MASTANVALKKIGSSSVSLAAAFLAEDDLVVSIVSMGIIKLSSSIIMAAGAMSAAVTRTNVRQQQQIQ
jgi:hypothetical protein